MKRESDSRMAPGPADLRQTLTPVSKHTHREKAAIGDTDDTWRRGMVAFQLNRIYKTGGL